MKIEVTVMISRSSHGHMTLSFQDEISRTTMLEVEMSPEDFGNAITGLVVARQKARALGLENVGKRYETKQVMVPWPAELRMYHAKEKVAMAVRAALTPFEVDGWKGRDSDMLNIRNRTRCGCFVSVTFTRHVSKEEDEEADHGRDH